MKKFTLFVLAILFIPFIFAIDVDVTENSNNLFIVGDSSPITASILIKNNGDASTFSIYNLVGFNMDVESFSLKSGEQKQVLINITPREKMSMRGLYALEYFIKDKSGSSTSEKLKIRVIEPKDAFEIGAEDISLDGGNITLYIKNNENYSFNKINAEFSSELFNFEENFSLQSYGKKTFNLELNNEGVKKLLAGFYTIKTTVTTLNQTGLVEGNVKFLEKNSVETTTDDSGFFIQKKVIQKVNNGNTIAKQEITAEKNIFNRFFTIVEPKADLIERDGFSVKYTWFKELNPNQEETITIKTNWFFPIIVLALIILIVYLTLKFTKTDVLIKKKVNYVRTNGGEFALKVTILVKAQNYIERLNIVDKLPALVKVYPRFGGEQPSSVNEEKRRIDWRFEKMEAREVKKITYIVYSKVGILGRFVLPRAKGVYEKNGEIKQVYSNKSFFASRKNVKE